MDPSSPSHQPKTPPIRSAGRLLLNLVKELLTTIVPALILALLLTHFVVQNTVVYSCSMEPTLHQDQRLIVEKISYHLHSPQRGDVVVIDRDDAEIPLIKRVIGLPGESLQIKNNQVYIDDQLLQEPYLPPIAQRDYGPVEIPADHIFVMGDNRNNSHDSRALGPFSIDRTIGRAWVSYWPLEKLGWIE
jgi:signal peptidase I